MTIGGIYISHPGSYALIAIFVLIEIAGMGDHTLAERLSLSTYEIRFRKEWYRLISAGFVHIGWLHVFMNAMGIYYFGMLVLGWKFLPSDPVLWFSGHDHQHY